MKKLFIFIFMISLSISALAQEAKTDSEDSFKDKAFSLLINQIDHLHLVGDVKKGESLKPVFNEIGEIVAYAFGSILGGRDEDEPEPKSNIEKFDYNCSPQGACLLEITEKTGGHTRYAFSVHLNQKNEPVRIIDNRVVVSKTSAQK